MKFNMEKFNMEKVSYQINMEKFSYQIINALAVNQGVFCYYQKFAKIIIKKKTLLLAVTSNSKICTFLNSCKTDLAKLIWIDFGKSNFLKIYIFNCYKAPFSTGSSIFRHLEFIRAIRMISCSFHHCVFLRTDNYVFINT